MVSKAMILPKSHNSNISHDGALSIRNFVLNEVYLALGTLLGTTKKYAPFFRGNMEFPICFFRTG
jgi:hypothetical protein